MSEAVIVRWPIQILTLARLRNTQRYYWGDSRLFGDGNGKLHGHPYWTICKLAVDSNVWCEVDDSRITQDIYG
jgi:hypothetical protein